MNLHVQRFSLTVPWVVRTDFVLGGEHLPATFTGILPGTVNVLEVTTHGSIIQKLLWTKTTNISSPSITMVSKKSDPSSTERFPSLRCRLRGNSGFLLNWILFCLNISVEWSLRQTNLGVNKHSGCVLPPFYGLDDSVFPLQVLSQVGLDGEGHRAVVALVPVTRPPDTFRRKSFWCEWHLSSDLVDDNLPHRLPLLRGHVAAGQDVVVNSVQDLQVTSLTRYSQHLRLTKWSSFMCLR